MSRGFEDNVQALNSFDRVRAISLPGKGRVPEMASPFDFALRLAVPVWIYDIDEYRIVHANPAALELWQAKSQKELSARNFYKDMSSTVAAKLKEFKAAFSNSDTIFTDLWTLYPNGKPVSVNVSMKGYRLPDGRIGMLCEASGVSHDAPGTLRAAEALLHTDVMIALCRIDGTVLYRNPASLKAWPLDAEFLQDIFLDDADQQMIADLPLNGDHRKVCRVRTREDWAWHDISYKLSPDAVTGAPAIVVTAIDVTELKLARDTATFLANRDQLTGCSNRFSLQTEVEKKLRSFRSHDMALLFIDLDHFKQINDNHGHEAGDNVLKSTQPTDFSASTRFAIS